VGASLKRPHVGVPQELDPSSSWRAARTMARPAGCAMVGAGLAMCEAREGLPVRGPFVGCGAGSPYPAAWVVEG